ncbi:MAG: MBL fold metallo-hydrolase [Candidatus Bathyarchaeota archaeon]|nr:MAG: MBL fold metallo-hydrolase [Candidatus Bathyarchaeota archaeon]
MIVERFKAKIVAHLSYFIGSGNDAMVVDPQRDCQIYIDVAQRERMRIKYIFETHRNEDYVIGSRELAHLTGAQVYHGPWPAFTYGNTLEDGQQFDLGSLKITATHTPGHTPGCMSYAVTDLDSGKDTILVCTGDTLFVNDVGRTDFGGPENRQSWSESLYDSIFNKLLPLGDAAIICPAHGAGSVCAIGIADREWSTLGLERQMNPVLQLSRAEFVEYKVNEHHEYVPYFRTMEKYNLEGAPFIGSNFTPKPLSVTEFQSKIEAGAQVVDTRSPSAFAGAHISDSYSIPHSVLSYAGWFIKFDNPILLVNENPNDLDYVVRSLVRIGYDNVEGYLSDGLSTWYRVGFPLHSLGLLTVQELKARLDAGEKLTLLDVRSSAERDEGYIESTCYIYLGHLEKQISDVPSDLPIVSICNIGLRASIAASLLRKHGFENVYNLIGGMSAWHQSDYPITH